MKLKKLLGLGIVLALVLSMIPNANLKAAKEWEYIYMLYNGPTGEYLYTADLNEVKTVTKCGEWYWDWGASPWTYQGLLWKAPKSGTPVYRLYYPGGMHLYTIDKNEIKELTKNHGWVVDNNGEPVFHSGGDADIYRFYEVNDRKRHKFEVTQREIDKLTEYGWRNEGVALKGYRISAREHAQMLLNRFEGFGWSTTGIQDVEETDTGIRWKTRLKKNDMFVDIYISSLNDTDSADYADWFWSLIKATVSDKELDKVPWGVIEGNGIEIEKGVSMKSLLDALTKY